MSSIPLTPEQKARATIDIPLSRAYLEEFVLCYSPANRHERQATWSHENERQH